MIKGKIETIVDKLEAERELEEDEYKNLINQADNEELLGYISEKARTTSKKYFSNKIYIRGLIEFTNYCRNDCYYCGIRAGNKNAQRYRMTEEEIIDCSKKGYELGFRTFVLQGGEDLYFDDEKLVSIIRKIKKNFGDCALTLSIGQRSFESYKRYFEAGVDRFLLRHETANDIHYGKLHPKDLTLSERKECLNNLKQIGYQTGTGFMVGSPFQTSDDIVQDLFFIKNFSPAMVGIGPFIPHKDTKFHSFQAGKINLTLLLISILRLMLPNVLIPATTALGTIDNKGREKGILFGANVLMPNLSPKSVRKKYSLYDNKICTGEEAAECVECLKSRVKKIGYEIVVDRGDFTGMIL